MEGKDFASIAGKKLKVVTNTGEEVVGTVYGYNAELKLLMLSKSSEMKFNYFSGRAVI